MGTYGLNLRSVLGLNFCLIPVSISVSIYAFVRRLLLSSSSHSIMQEFIRQIWTTASDTLASFFPRPQPPVPEIKDANIAEENTVEEDELAKTDEDYHQNTQMFGTKPRPEKETITKRSHHTGPERHKKSRNNK
jgi:hypothetical protein